MCLNKIRDFEVKLNKEGVGTGYKVFCEKGGELYGEYARVDKKRRVGVWLKEKNFRPRKTNNCIEPIGKRYERGWHIFITRQAADKWNSLFQCVRKIKFRGIVTMGRNASNSKVVVAKEIFIPREV